MNIILLRGLAREKSHWMDFPSRLVAGLAQLPVTPEQYAISLNCYDCLGCGEYYQQAVPASISVLTDHLRAQALSKEQDCSAVMPKYILVGLSMGGMMALDWAERFPQEVLGVILMNVSRSQDPLSWRLRPTCWPVLVRSLFLSSGDREKTILELVSNNRHNYAKNTQIWRDIQSVRPVSVSSIVKLLVAASKFKSPELLTVPGLVMTSEEDRLVSHRCSENIAQENNWPLIRHVSAGHDLPLDDPEWVVAQIVTWIQDTLSVS